MKACIQLEQREIDFMIELGEVGFLNTDLIHRRHYPTVTLRRCQQRLLPLQRHGLIQSVALTVWYGNGRGGRVPTIHCLTERGAEAVASVAGCRPERVVRSDPKPETLHHRLAIVQARLALDDACRSTGLVPPRWIMEQDRRDDVQRDTPPSRRRVLYHEFTAADKKFTCQPDAACLLQIPRDIDRPEVATTPLLAFLEVDRSTERTAQVASKCPGYAALLKQRTYRHYWPDAASAVVRVFWVCRSQRRIESLAVALRDKPVVESFRFTTVDELSAETALTLPIWQTIDGQRREILRLPPNTVNAFEPVGHPAPHFPPHVGP